MGAAIGTAVVGAVESAVMGVFKDNKIEDPGKQEEAKERINHLHDITKLKIDAFYNEITVQSLDKRENFEVPISKIVSKVGSTYAADSDTITNTLLATIEGVVTNVLGGNIGVSAFSSLVKGGLEAFFGPANITATGITYSEKMYNVVWYESSMVRVDTFVTKSVLSKMAGLNKSTQIFGGYMMVVSVVDLSRVGTDVIKFEFMKYYNAVRKNDPAAAEELLKKFEAMTKGGKETTSLHLKTSQPYLKNILGGIVTSVNSR